MLSQTDQPAPEPVQAGTVHGFSVAFSFPVSFTRKLWDPANRLFVDTVRRLEPGRRHRVLVAIDDHVVSANLQLVADIAAYFEAHAEHLALVGQPILVSGGEAAKNDLFHPINLLKQMNDAGMDRQSFVAVIGGGAVLDLVSFAAAICHRGIRTIRVPTTVLSQADSGVAVKNSVNMFGKKNFAGTFLPPFAVLNDFDFLETLDRRERRAGISEAIKVSLLRDPALFEYIEAHAGNLVAGDPEILARVVQRSAELHLAHICGNGDPFELGSARPLDFGHWAAHKLESMTAHSLRHGEAVAIGMALDVLYSVRMGFLARAEADRILRLLEAVGFRLWDDALARAEADGGLTLLAGLREFREHLGGELHITMLRTIGRSFEVTAMEESAIVASLYELAAREQDPRDIPSRAATVE
jgi:3-dehydroquinate synthase